MSQTFGMESPSFHTQTALCPPVRFVVVIDSGGSMIARLCRDTHDMVTEMDAAVEEVCAMTAGLIPTVGAMDSVWDHALAGHSAAERADARVYAIAV